MAESDSNKVGGMVRDAAMSLVNTTGTLFRTLKTKMAEQNKGRGKEDGRAVKSKRKKADNGFPWSIIGKHEERSTKEESDLAASCVEMGARLLRFVLQRPLLAIMTLDTVVGLFTQRRVPNEVILELDLEALKISPSDPDDVSYLEALRNLNDREVSLRTLLVTLKRASEDRRVKGLLVYVGSTNLEDMASVQELRNAILAFRSKGKHTVAFAESFGGVSEYLIACACQHVFLQPSGTLGLTGFQAESPFLKGLLDKWDIKPEMYAREEYKSAANMYKERGFTKAQRRNLSQLLGSLFSQLTVAVGRARGLGRHEVAALVDLCPLDAQAAVARGLTDGVLFRDGAVAFARALARGGPRSACGSIFPPPCSGVLEVYLGPDGRPAAPVRPLTHARTHSRTHKHTLHSAATLAPCDH